MSAPTITLSIPNLPDGVDNLTAALAYAAAGIYVVPVLRGTKNPGSILGKRWQTQSSRDPKQITAWFAGTDHDVALHCGRSGLVVYDVDKPANVTAVMAPHLKTAPFQPTRPSDPDRGHYVFAMPPGRTIGNPAFPWGEIRGLNGVIMAEPSSHADGGQYGPWQRAGAVAVLADELAKTLPDASPAEDAASDAEIDAFLDAHTEATRPEILAGWVKALGKRFADGESRHQSTVTVLVGAMKEARAGYFPARTAIFDTIRPLFLDEVAKAPISDKQDAPRTGRKASLEFYGILAWAVGQANAADLDEVRARVEEKMFDNRAWMLNISVNGQAAAKIDEAAFWDAYPELTFCRNYARSVRVGPLAMLCGALTFASATIPPNVVLPGTVGDYASVNLYANLVGESGAIKSAAIAAAQVWLNTVPAPEPVKPGSGQGVAKCFAYVKTTKNGPVQVGKRWNAVAVVPEVDTLTAAGSMTGSSLWAELRSAWSDERVGHDYADATKSIVLQPRRYRLCMIVGVQPKRAGPLFEDVDAGTPQRFVWFPVDDPGAPERRPALAKALDLPEWPGTTVASFFDDYAQKLHEPVDRSTLSVLTIPAEAEEAIDAVARGKLRGEKGIDPLDGHLLLCQLKIAASLMRLCNRTDEVTSKDWELAAVIMKISARTRAQAQNMLDAERNRRNFDAAQVSGARKIVETRMVAKAEAEDIARVADVIVAALGAAAGQTLPGHKVNKAVASRDRRLVDKALEYLEIDDQIEIEEVKYHGRPGIKVTLLQQTKGATP